MNLFERLTRLNWNADGDGEGGEGDDGTQDLDPGAKSFTPDEVRFQMGKLNARKTKQLDALKSTLSAKDQTIADLTKKLDDATTDFTTKLEESTKKLEGFDSTKSELTTLRRNQDLMKQGIAADVVDEARLLITASGAFTANAKGEVPKLEEHLKEKKFTERYPQWFGGKVEFKPTPKTRTDGGGNNNDGDKPKNAWGVASQRLER